MEKINYLLTMQMKVHLFFIYAALILICTVVTSRLSSQIISPAEPRLEQTGSKVNPIETSSYHSYSKQNLRSLFEKNDNTPAHEAVRTCDSSLFYLVWDVYQEVWPKTPCPYTSGMNFAIEIDHDFSGVDALSWAAKHGYVSSVKFILKEKEKIDSRQYKKWKMTWNPIVSPNYLDLKRALYVAIDADSNQEEIVKLLINEGAEINSVSSGTGETPLDLACRRGDISFVKFLIERGAIIEHHSSVLESSPLTNALGWDKLNDIRKAVAQLLISKGADPTYAFTYLVAKADRSTLDFLLSSGADVNARNLVNTPLMTSVSSGNLNLAKWLLSKGAKVNTISTNGKSAISLAVEAGQYQAVKWLLEKGAKIGFTNSEGQTLLHLAILYGNLSNLYNKQDIALMLIRLGANMKALDNQGRSIYCYADCARMKDILEKCEAIGVTRPCPRGSPCP